MNSSVSLHKITNELKIAQIAECKHHLYVNYFVDVSCHEFMTVQFVVPVRHKHLRYARYITFRTMWLIAYVFSGYKHIYMYPLISALYDPYQLQDMIWVELEWFVE